MPGSVDVLVIGAGAAGLMCAIEAGRSGRSVRVIDHAAKPAEKIRISGGGRCNFTNLDCRPAAFLSENPMFCVSALKRFSQHDFIERVTAHGIPFHEKKLGQLFCDRSAGDIIAMLLDDLNEAGATLDVKVEPGAIERTATGYRVETSAGPVNCASLVIATGGKSIPKMGATGYAYDVARQFGLAIIEPRPALVPLTFAEPHLAPVAALAGVSVEARVSCGKTSFEEGLLFTHRGLSGPSVLQISSYWREGDTIAIDLAHGRDAFTMLKQLRLDHPRQTVATALATLLPRRLAEAVAERSPIAANQRLADLSDVALRTLARDVHDWRVMPQGSEGYRTAEVTLGGIDTKGLSSRTMESAANPGLYFIGECVDVTGWLGGYNFQWAWSSGWAAGQVA
jgi:predicted Rossmann fold flavoprotein